jgi:hypothetical protein
MKERRKVLPLTGSKRGQRRQRLQDGGLSRLAIEITGQPKLSDAITCSDLLQTFPKGEIKGIHDQERRPTGDSVAPNLGRTENLCHCPKAAITERGPATQQQGHFPGVS